MRYGVPKTEIIHKRTALQMKGPGSSASPSICLDRLIFAALSIVRWLSYWLTPNLSSAAVTGLFLSKENTIELAIDLLALVLREASRYRSLEG